MDQVRGLGQFSSSNNMVKSDRTVSSGWGQILPPLDSGSVKERGQKRDHNYCLWLGMTNMDLGFQNF